MHIDFFTYKHGDWSLELSEEQRKSIDRGLLDIEENRIISHTQLQEKIKILKCYKDSKSQR